MESSDAITLVEVLDMGADGFDDAADVVALI